jgi:hypothetical protein
LVVVVVVVAPIRVIPFRIYAVGLAVTAGWLQKGGEVQLSLSIS